MQEESTGQDEVRMISAVLAGDAQVYHELIRPYERRVYAMALSFMKNESDAEDVVQEAFLKGFQNLASFRAEAKFSTWLISITLNEARSRLHRQKIVRMESLDDADEDGPKISPALLRDWREVPLEALERQEIREMLRKAIDELPQIYREVLLLRDVEELSIQETTEALGLSVSAVKVRLHRARMMMQKSLAPQLKSSQPEVVPMMIECKHVWDHISGYLDDTLSPQEREEVQRHLEHCEVCSAILDSTRNIVILTGDERVFELPVGFSQRLHTRLDETLKASESKDSSSN